MTQRRVRFVLLVQSSLNSQLEKHTIKNKVFLFSVQSAWTKKVVMLTLLHYKPQACNR